jgi:hypothetical protein
VTRNPCWLVHRAMRLIRHRRIDRVEVTEVLMKAASGRQENDIE